MRLWTLKGCPRLDSGEYVIAEVVAWLRERDRQELREELKPQEKVTQLQRKAAAEADFKELQVAQLRANLVTAEFHEQHLVRVIGGFAAVSKGQLTRFERDMIAVTDAAEARRLTERIHEALMEGSQDLADALETEIADDEAA